MTATTLIILLLLASTFTSNAQPCSSSSPPSDSTLTLFHIYGKCSPYVSPVSASWQDTVLDMASKDTDRVRYLTSLTSIIDGKKTKVPVGSGQQILQTANYIVRTKFGTPGQLMFMVLDTSNDVSWIPCAGCSGCSTTLFSSNLSSTYQTLDCKSPQCGLMSNPTCSDTSVCLFNQTYGGASSFAAELSSDTLRLALDVIPGYGFGCMKSVSGTSIPPQGLFGLGRGPMSLLSQTGQLYQGVFSYCLPSFKSYYFSGSLKLGPTGQPVRIKTTPLLLNPHRPSLYYVNLTGISIGRYPVAVPSELLEFNPVTGAGTIIDSGTVITRFVTPIYIAMRDEFRKTINGSVSSLGAFDTCFTGPQVVPLVTLHFTGLDLTLPMENTLIHSSSGSMSCLAMAAAPDNVNSVLNVIANLQQQNHRVVFDVANSRVGITRELCN